MPKAKYDAAEIKKIVAEKDKKSVDEICKDYKISKQTFFKYQRGVKGKSKGKLFKKSTNRTEAIKEQITRLKLELAESVLQEA